MITIIFEDSQDRIWIGSQCDGIISYDPSTNTKELFTVNNGLPKKNTTELYDRQVYCGNSIRSIQEDEEGNIFIGTGDGIVKYDGHKFEFLLPIDSEVNLDIYIASYYMTMDSNTGSLNDKIWFKDSSEEGVFIYDNKVLTHYSLPQRTADLISADEDPHPFKYAVYSLFKDSDNDIWLGTSGAGIMKIDESGNYECVNAKEKKGIVRAFYEDQKTQMVWISNVTQGVSYLDYPFKQSLKSYTKKMGFYNLDETRSDPNLDSAKLFDSVQTISKGSDGGLWFGTYSNGLWHQDQFGLTLYNIENGLPSDCVKTIYRTKKGELLFGIGETSSQLYTFNGDDFVEF